MQISRVFLEQAQVARKCVCPGYDGSFTTPDCHEQIKWLLGGLTTDQQHSGGEFPNTEQTNVGSSPDFLDLVMTSDIGDLSTTQWSSATIAAIHKEPLVAGSFCRTVRGKVCF